METKFDLDEFIFAYPDGIEGNYWNQARNKTILRSFGEFSPGKIIDVGAGRGIVTGYLHNHGLSIQGVELGKTTPVSKSNAPVMYNTDVLSLSAEQASEYTTVSFFDVIEHIEDPVKF